MGVDIREKCAKGAGIFSHIALDKVNTTEDKENRGIKLAGELIKGPRKF